MTEENGQRPKQQAQITGLGGNPAAEYHSDIEDAPSAGLARHPGPGGNPEEGYHPDPVTNPPDVEAPTAPATMAEGSPLMKDLAIIRNLLDRDAGLQSLELKEFKAKLEAGVGSIEVVLNPQLATRLAEQINASGVATLNAVAENGKLLLLPKS